MFLHLYNKCAYNSFMAQGNLLNKGSKMEVKVNEKMQMVYAPSINKLYEALEKMVVAGVDRDAPLVISHLENSLGTFVIYELND